MFILKDSALNMVKDVISSDPNRFPDNTLSLGKISKYFDSILWLYDNDAELFTLQCLRQHTIRPNITLVMPYIPHARMDRTENCEVFTLKTFCSIINSLNFKKVVVADPHSNVSIALLDRVETLNPGSYIYAALEAVRKDSHYPNMADFVENMVFFFPDAGAMKRYSKMFPQMKYAYGEKDRDWDTGEIKGVKVINGELVKDKVVIIVDDICSKGGTFAAAAASLLNLGALDVYLYVTHCEKTVFEGSMYKSCIVKKVFTTDSLSRTVSNRIDVVHSFEDDFRNGHVF